MSSEYIRAVLGNLDMTVERRLGEWAKANCVAHRLERSPSGDVVLYAQRPEKKTSKSHKMTLRTLFQNWGAMLTLEGSDWLQLLSHDDFTKAAGDAQEPPRPHAESPEQSGATKHGAVFLSSLPHDFAEKSHALLMELRQGSALTCAA